MHVHTKYSFDAYAFSTVASPDDAYRFAKGEAIKNPGGFDMQLSEPFDDDCSFSANTGDAELRTAWTDPNFDASERAFYYARVLETPTCRWSTWDVIKSGTEPRSDLTAALQ